MSCGKMALSARRSTSGGNVDSVRKADHLAQGMNAGVGPAAGQHAHLLAGDFGDGLFQRFLNGRLARLRLPAGVVRAVVGDGELEGSHGLVAGGTWKESRTSPASGWQRTRMALEDGDLLFHLIDDAFERLEGKFTDVFVVTGPVEQSPRIVLQAIAVFREYFPLRVGFEDS